MALERLAEKRGQLWSDRGVEAAALRLLFTLGIANISGTRGKTLARHFGTMDRIALATTDDVLPYGIGEILAESLVSWFADEKAINLIKRLNAAGLTMDEPQTQSGDALKGMTVVITGTLPTLSREQAGALVEANGGRVASSVSKKTSFVLVGADAGTKLAKAQELGVKIIDEAGFRELIGG